MEDLGPLIYSNQMTESLAHALFEGEHGLNNAPLLIKRIIEEGHWRKRYIDRLKKVVEFENFVDFVTSDPLPGLGANVSLLRRICADDLAARDALETALAGKPGNPTGANQYTQRGIGLNQSNSSPKRDRAGNHILALKRHHPERHKRVIAGEITVHQACVETGIFPRRVSVNLQSPESAAKTLIKHTDPEFLDRVMEEIQKLKMRESHNARIS